MPCSIKDLFKILDDVEHRESKRQHGRSKIHILRAKSHVSESTSHTLFKDQTTEVPIDRPTYRVKDNGPDVIQQSYQI